MRLGDTRLWRNDVAICELPSFRSKERWSGVVFKAFTPVGKAGGQWDSMLERERTSAYQQGTSPDGGQVRTCSVTHIGVLCVLNQHLTPQPNRGTDIELVSHPQNKLTITQQNH